MKGMGGLSLKDRPLGTMCTNLQHRKSGSGQENNANAPMEFT